MRRPPSRNTVCSTKVDFPMPGSPPNSTSDPGTNPPPNTRFSSPSHMSIRGSSSAAIRPTGTGAARKGSAADACR